MSLANYRLGWSEIHLSEMKHEDPDVATQTERTVDGDYEHYYDVHFFASNDEEARLKAREIVSKFGLHHEIYSIYRADERDAVFTEEDL